MLRFFIFSVLLFKFRNSHGLPKNVCSSFSDYTIMSLSPNCWHDPDVGSTPDAIAGRYGYSFELHTAITDDGYKLRLFRIPPKKKWFNESRVVFLQHGILVTAMSWLSLSKQSLAFKLSDSGYDVWLGNFRGSIYSNEHIKLSSISDDEYWDFSFYELGYYDLQAMLKCIVKTTKTKNKIIYIGYSLGTTAAYIYSITRKTEANERLAALISLGPMAYMRNSSMNLVVLAKLNDLIYGTSRSMNINYIGISKELEKQLFYSLCLYTPTRHICRQIALIVFYVFSSSIAPEKLPIVLTQAPAATSMKMLRHFGQEILNNGLFQAFDYGFFNYKIYGSAEPPVYNVSEIIVPVYLLYGKNDRVADEQDVKILFDHLKTTKFIIPIEEHDHVDFIFSENTQNLYNRVFTIVGNLTNT